MLVHIDKRTNMNIVLDSFTAPDFLCVLCDLCGFLLSRTFYVAYVVLFNWNYPLI